MLQKSYTITGCTLPLDDSQNNEIYAFKHAYPHLSRFLHILKMH